jgi:ubiquinone/menaquinone biosynthesis C-methylase UbiE
MLYQVMDVMSMTYADKSFEFVLDKSTIDALLCSDSPIVSVARMTREIYRVLKDDGVYLIVSYGAP